MSAAPFAYVDPGTLSEVLDLLDRLEDTRLLAGGQSLIPYMQFRMARPAVVVDLNRVGELAHITDHNGRLEIGAMTRQRALAESEIIRAQVPIAHEALRLIGHVATRPRGTLGGSVANLDPSAELIAVTALHDGVLHVRSVRGERVLGVADWARDLLTPALDPGEMLTRIDWAPWPTGHGHAFLEFSKRHHDYAVVAAGALMTVDEQGRITRAAAAVAGVGIIATRLTAAERLLVGEVGRPELFAEAARAAADLEPLTDTQANTGYPRRFVSAGYRRHLGQVLTRRTLHLAHSRALGQQERR
ncbi:FAD binding domain-containing protein [Nocardia sp. NPDC049707]|uniref:FAD binding domain-containing protein n=1 Tax=Nocardia sp. NPDC049707 TaxID=3154735 RepID=UPI0034467AF0